MIKIFSILYLIFLLIFSIFILNLIDPQPQKGKSFPRDYIDPVCNNKFCIYGIIVYTADVIHTSDTFIYLSKSITYEKKDMILRYNSKSESTPMITIKNDHTVEIFENDIYSITKYKRHMDGISINLDAQTINSDVEDWIRQRNKILVFYVISIILFILLHHSIFIRALKLFKKSKDDTQNSVQPPIERKSGPECASETGKE